MFKLSIMMLVKTTIKYGQALIFLLFFANLSPAKSFATLDWTVAETLLALGEPPIAIGDKSSYHVWVNEPKLAEQTIDLGIRLQPNPEQIFALSQTADLQFINSRFYAQTTPMLSAFSSVEMVDFYDEGNAWQNILNATKQIATLIGKPEQAEKLFHHFSQKMAETQPLVQSLATRPIALVQFSDSRHLRIYGQNSLFGEVLHQLGLQNAWQQTVNVWGFEHIEVTQLAKLPKNTRLVIIKPYPSNIESALKYNTLWKALPLAQDPLILPAVWTFGGIPSALRFTHQLEQAVRYGGEPW